MAKVEQNRDISKYTLPGQIVWENMLLMDNHPIEVFQKAHNFPLQRTDVVVSSYPKSGTTLLQELVWLVRNNANVEMSRSIPNFFRIPFIDIKIQGPKTFDELYCALSQPKTIKTHVPFKFLPKPIQDGDSKCIYVIRNPKDTLVSYYHFHRMNSTFGNFWGTWDDFFAYFKRSDYKLLYGNPFDHNLTYWEKREQANILVVFYEDLLLDKENSVRKLNKFLEANLTEEQIKRVVEVTSFKSMKSSPFTSFEIDKLAPLAPGEKPVLDNSISPFLRKGEIGDWKNYFNEEQNRIVDEMCDRKLSGTGLKFRFE